MAIDLNVVFQGIIVGVVLFGLKYQSRINSEVTKKLGELSSDCAAVEQGLRDHKEHCTERWHAHAVAHQDGRDEHKSIRQEMAEFVRGINQKLDTWYRGK